MDIMKRNGRQEDYDGQKIIRAMRKAFESTGSNPAPSVMADLLVSVEEMLADKNVLGKEISCKKTIGRTPLEAVGFCETDEEYPDEASVYIKTLTVAGTVFEIEDYLL